MVPPQGSRPCSLQFSKRLQESLSLGKNQECLSRNEVLIEISDEFTEDSLDPITSDSPAESLSYYDTDPACGVIHGTSQDIEEICREPSSVPLDPFDITTCSQEYSTSPCSMRCHKIRDLICLYRVPSFSEKTAPTVHDGRPRQICAPPYVDRKKHERAGVLDRDRQQDSAAAR